MSNITTDKEAFEFVTTRLLEQNSQCVDIGHDCQYRGFTHDETFMAWDNISSNDNDDLVHYLLEKFGGYTAKCAAGWLIDDNFYDPFLEGRTVDDEVLLAIKKSHPNWNMTEESVEMIRMLQNIHDRSTPKGWEKEFASFSNCFDDNGNCKQINWMKASR